MWIRMVMVILLLSVLAGAAAGAPPLPPCTQRPLFEVLPRTQIGVCAERIFRPPHVPGQWSAGLAIDREGTLYIGRPMAGEVWALRDSDGDGVPDAARAALRNLDRPSSLLYHEGVLYIAGGQALYRWQDGTLETVTDALPDSGQPSGGLAFHEGALYLGIGAGCAWCAPSADRGQLVRVNLEDGTLHRAITTHFPALVASVDGSLYFSDRTAGEDVIRRRDRHDAPVVARFPLMANPLALAAYRGDAFPHFVGRVLLLLSGNESAENPPGFQLLLVDGFGGAGALADVIIPGDERMPTAALSAAAVYTNPQAADYVRNGESTYPHRMTGLAISPQGWIYVLLGNGSVHLLRP